MNHYHLLQRIRQTLVLGFTSACLLIFPLVDVHAQVPVYNSYPTAQATIFLDFDGQIVEGTSWNTGDAIVCEPSGLNNTQITEVFNRVAEDYRPFDLNITTDPAKYLAAPVDKRMRVIITVTSSWYGPAGGVSFTGSFTWGDDTPCFVFSALLNYNTKNIAEAVAHEAGHTLGLFHQASYDANCNITSEYNYGLGSGQTGWAPIMGVGYYRNFTLWNNGPTPYGCSSLQNDLAVITTNNGFGYRADDYPSTIGTALPISMTNNQFQFSGVIEKSTDLDFFKISLPSNGQMHIDAVPYNVGTGNSGSNLDIKFSLFNSSQTIIGVYNPSDLLNSSIDTLLNTGVYYMKVEGTGNSFASNFASLGSYSLQGIFTPTGLLPLHKLELHGSLSGDKHMLNWIIEADEQVIKQELEYSTGGTQFAKLAEPLNSERDYTCKPVSGSSVQYRLKVTFDNGRTYYTNIVRLLTENSQRPTVINSMVNNNRLLVSCPIGEFVYAVFDNSGKVLAQGKLMPAVNEIDISRLAGGIYYIQFSGNGNHWTDKFMK